MEFAKVARIARDNYLNSCSYYADCTFEYPSAKSGYGAVLNYLKNAGVPTTRKAILTNLGVKPNSNSTVFERLRFAKLIEHTTGGYILTDLGRNYVDAWRNWLSAQ